MKTTFSLLLLLLFSCTRPPAPELGLTMKGDNFYLQGCLTGQNCVSTHEPQNTKNHIPPIKIVGDEEKFKLQLIDYLKKTAGFKITKQESGDYIRATFTSSVFKFVDDIEFYLPGDNTLQMRSSSRLGYYDFGKNRERLETIRFKYLQRSL